MGNNQRGIQQHSPKYWGKSREPSPKFGDVFSNLKRTFKPSFRTATFEHVPDGALFLVCDISFVGTKGKTTLDYVPRGAALRRCLHKSVASLSAQVYDEHVCVYRKAGQAAEFVRGYREGVGVADVAGSRHRDHIFNLDTPCVFVDNN